LLRRLPFFLTIIGAKMKHICKVLYLLLLVISTKSSLSAITGGYITNSFGNTVSVIDTATNTLAATIVVGTNPQFIAISPDGTRAYVTNSGDNSLSVIDTITNTVVTTIPLGTSPLFVAVTPDGTQVYITGQSTNSVVVVDASTNAIIANIPVGLIPQFLNLTPDGAQVYVTNFNSNNVSVISTASLSVTDTIPVGGGPQFVVVSPNGAKAYVTNALDGTVSIIDTSTNLVTTVIPVGTSPFFITFTFDSAQAYVTNVSDNTVSVINAIADTVTTTIPVGITPQYMTISPDGTEIYVPNSSVTTVSIISTLTNSVIATVGVGNNPIFPAISSNGLQAYITNLSDATVSVIDTTTNTVIATVPVGLGPFFIAIPQALPSLTSINPNNGPEAGGTIVTIQGTHFIDGNTQVFFGVTPATNVTVLSSSTLTATAPSGIGVVDVTIVTPFGITPVIPADEYTYNPILNVPSVEGLDPNFGPESGGTVVIISGTHFVVGGTQVFFGETPALSVNVVSENTLIAVAPSGIGTLDVRVETAFGISDVTNADQYTYVSNPFVVVTGLQKKNIFLTEKELYNVITWESVDSIQPVLYLIYRNAGLTDLAGNVSSNKPLIFIDHNRQKNKKYSYYIVALTQRNEKYLIGSVTILPTK
jgi:YVTN family beta-propeller protein